MSSPTPSEGQGPTRRPAPDRWQRIAWSLFLASLVALVLSSTFYRREGRQPMADEATVLMQAASLAWDFDLRYDRGDHDRELFRWLGQPERLELTWGSGPTPRVGYDSPSLGAVALAPFLRLWPRHGFALANALALALALGLVATRLAHAAGDPGDPRSVATPLVLLLLMVLSPLVVAVFRARLEVLVLAALMVATTWIVSPDEDRSPLQVLAAGLLSLPALVLSWTHLAVVAWLAGWLGTSAPPIQRQRLLVLFACGLVMGGLAEVGLDTTLGAGASVEARGSFTASTGFPEIDFEPDAEGLHRGALESSSSRVGRGPSSWTLVDLWVGRTGGIVPLFPAILPILLGVLLAKRWGVLLLIVGWSLLTAGLRPFDLGSGWVAGGPAFLPTYGALVVIAVVGALGINPWSWKARGRALAGVVGLLAVVWGALVLTPIWSQPWRLPDLGPRAHLAPATAWLPAATTQRPVGSRRGSLGGLEVLVVGEGAWIEARSDRLKVEEPIELWILTSEPLDALVLETLDGGLAPRIEGARLAESGTDGTAWRLDLPTGRRHSLAWTDGPRWVYRWSLDPVAAKDAPRAFGLHRMGAPTAAVDSGETPREER